MLRNKIKSILLKKVNLLDQSYDAAILKLRKKLRRLGPVFIQTYKGYGNSKAIYLKGRVLKFRNIKPAQENDTTWKNLRAMVRRFRSVEIPNVRVKAKYLNTEKTALTDKEGYYNIILELNDTLPERTFWIEVDLELLDNIHPGQGRVDARGKVMITEGNSEFGVISDVDDTILTTDATSLFRMLKLTFLNNARTRLPFAGVAAFYQALQKGSTGTQNNPLFYVSSSPWNLYDLLIDFCMVHDIPTGPFMLRDFGIDETKFFTDKHLNHKTNEIEKILSFYKDLNFILIGDSGQHDPEIYLQVLKDFPGRIKAIYIRDVTNEDRRISVNAIAEEMKVNHDVQMLLVKDTEEAAKHAAENNYIDPRNIPDIIQEKIEDKNAPTDLEQLIGIG